MKKEKRKKKERKKEKKRKKDPYCNKKAPDNAKLAQCEMQLQH
jgi:hypothetical protein